MIWLAVLLLVFLDQPLLGLMLAFLILMFEPTHE